MLSELGKEKQPLREPCEKNDKNEQIKGGGRMCVKTVLRSLRQEQFFEFEVSWAAQ